MKVDRMIKALSRRIQREDDGAERRILENEVAYIEDLSQGRGGRELVEQFCLT